MHSDGRLVGVKGPPRLLLSIECELRWMLDLSDEAVQSQLEIARPELFVPWLPFVGTGIAAPTQELGAAAYTCGRFSALRAPSVRAPESFNLIVFPDRLRGGESIKVFDETGGIRAVLDGM
jgi:hypothetical protein